MPPIHTTALIKTHSSLTLTQRTISPRDIPQSHALVRIATTGLCRTDLYIAQGTLSVPLPRILGHEASGTVITSTNPSLPPNTRVAIHPLIHCATCPTCTNPNLPNTSCPNATFLGMTLDGTLTTHAILPTHALHPIPPSLSFQHAAFAEPVAASLAVTNAPIQPQHSILIFGSGRIALLTARVLQARGFQHITLHDPTHDPPLQADQFDAAIETALSTQHLETLLHTLKPRGVLVLKSRHIHPVSFIPSTLLRKEQTLQPTHYAPFHQALSLLQNPSLHTDDLFGETFPLTHWQDAMHTALQSESRKIFIRSDSPS